MNEEEILERWKEHFKEVLNVGSGGTRDQRKHQR